MGDAATVVRRRRDKPTEETQPRMVYPHAVPLPPTPGTVRVRGAFVTRSGWVARTYEIPPDVLAQYLIHERVPDALPTVCEQLYCDMYLESQ